MLRGVHSAHGDGAAIPSAHPQLPKTLTGIQGLDVNLSRIIDDLLDASRLVLGKVALSRRPVDFAEAVRRGVSTATGTGLADRFIHVSTEPAWINADPDRIEQIVSNLVENAIKYTSTGGRITVTLAADGREAVLRVEDDGVGIAQHMLSRTFEPFVQGDATLDRGSGGLGIGLTLVKRLVHLHQGTLSVRSEGVDRGSAFVVRLPAIPAPADQEFKSEIRAKPPQRRVLLIEDNADSRDMYRLLLELDGHDVLEADDGTRGLELLRTELPDLALVDIGLPTLDGYEIARRFRAEPGADRTVLIALTGYGSVEDRERSREAGFDYHLVKPVSADMVREILTGVVTDPELRTAAKPL